MCFDNIKYRYIRFFKYKSQIRNMYLPVSNVSFEIVRVFTNASQSSQTSLRNTCLRRKRSLRRFAKILKEQAACEASQFCAALGYVLSPQVSFRKHSLLKYPSNKQKAPGDREKRSLRIVTLRRSVHG